MSSENKVLTRFAPSPTGNLHIGNARSAILNWIYAEKFNGNFILRIDDTDKERSKEEFIDSIKEDLKWLGVKWEYTFKQSESPSAKGLSFKPLATRDWICLPS